MSGTVVVGMQWGDEGKGKITDFLSRDADVVTRYQGGDNAGHTIKQNGQTYHLRTIPSGILHADKTCVLGNGIVLNPKSLVAEIARLHEAGVSTANLVISDRAHIILPYHIALDKAQENYRDDNKIGTTNRGIGPAYTDKAERSGIRMVDLLDKDTFAKKLATNLKFKNELLTKIYQQAALDYDEIFNEFYDYGQQLKDYVVDSSELLNDRIDKNENLLFEGAQATMLDLDHGTYPFVTSSNPTAGGACVGAGVGPRRMENIVGVVKAYTTRVGAGPFPAEQDNEVGEYLRQTGHEFGTVTGRSRRCGWFDAAVVRYAAMLNSLDYLAVTRLDILDGLEKINICTGYRCKGEVLEEYPESLTVLEQVEPIYEELPGWKTGISACRTYADLPENARKYVERISELVGVPLGIISVGPDREQTIVLRRIF